MNSQQDVIYGLMNELEEALAKREITDKQYQKTAEEGEKLHLFLQKNSAEFLRFCSEWREKLLLTAEA